MKRRLLLLGILVAVATLAVVRTRRELRDLATADAVCDAARRAAWSEALEHARRQPARPAAARRTAECACVAHLETGDRPGCVARLDALHADDPDWLPPPPLAAVHVEALRDDGRLEEAEALARRGALAHPDEFILSYLELDLRSRREGETPVLEELAARVLHGESRSLLLRLYLAESYLARSEWEPALALLDIAAPELPEQRQRWYRARSLAFAADGRQRDLRACLEAWRRDGGHEAEIDARYAVYLSSFTLRDPEASDLDWLRRALARVDELDDRELAGTLYARAIRTFSLLGEEEMAVELHRRASAEFGDVSGLTAEEMERSLADAPSAEPGVLVFRIESRAAGDRLLLSPPPSRPVDAAYEALAAGSGTVSAERRGARVPQRWVLVDADGVARASGAVWPAAGRPTEIRVVRGEPHAPPSSPALSRRPADGRRRVVLVVLDSGDWRLVQYLRARRELPVLDELARAGLSGVLDSDPPYTAAAMQALVHPARRGPGSFLGVLHQVGREVETMNFVGRNPAAWLEWVLPAEADLFETVGAGDRVAANLLRSFGALEFGRHARLTGPYGRERTISGYAGRRPFTDADAARLPDLGRWVDADPRARANVEELSADFDSVVRLVEEGEADLVALRVDATDLATHSHYAAVATTRQDDGDAFLFALYREADRRLGELARTLDADDVLVVLSDHGTESALKHDPSCLFLVHGAGVPAGRVDGRPSIRGVARMLAELLGIETDWPSTGLDDWVAKLATADQAAVAAFSPSSTTSSVPASAEASRVRATSM